MSTIIELSQQIANQIAAGEVIERPASVVKELIENALDAQSSSIAVHIKDGGFSYIIVQDDGIGMDAEDLSLSIKRYATSKLTSVSDLDHLQSFGFRGEALPSIASISRMTITSKRKTDDIGHRAIVEAGVLRDLFSAASPMGTRIEVRDLFFNVPARLKFVKSKRAEMAEIDRLLRSYAFTHPSISWKLFLEKEMLWSQSATENLVDIKRATNLLGADTEGQLCSFEGKTDLLDVNGVVSSPLVIRRDSRSMVFFVNHRLVHDRKLTMAIKTAFRSLLEVGRYPICALNINVAPDVVDVNVHPRKTEVRFQDERRVIAHIIGILSDFLATTPWLSATNNQPSSLYYSPAALSDNAETNFTPRSAHSFSFTATNMPELAPRKSWLAYSATPVQKPLLQARRFCDLEILGQLNCTFILTQSDEGFVVVDQHAAHERIMYEKIRRQQSQRLVLETLLIPITLTLNSADLALLEAHLSDMNNLGIAIEIFGKDTVVIRALPAFMQRCDVAALVRDVIADLANNAQSIATDQLFSDMCATLACHGSIRAGQRLSREEMSALLAELDDTDFGAHCPHGRPLVKSFSHSDVKKWFDRT